MIDGISFNDYYNYNIYMKKESKQERARERCCERWGVGGGGSVNRWRAGERVARTST